MSLMVIGVIAVVAIAIVVVVLFLLKNKNAGGNHAQSAVNQPKTLAEQQRELIERAHLPKTVVEPTSTADDDLRTAQNLINQQDFAGATKLLKQSIKTNPTRSDVYYMLLNTFALSKDYNSFNQFYPTVVALDNPVTTSQAQNLKKLIDEELSLLNQPKPTTTVPDKMIDFDFDVSDETEQAPVAQTVTPAVDEIDISTDFDFDLPSETVAPTPTPVAETVADISTDFDFDLPSETVAPTPTPVAETVADISTDFDFDLPSETVAPTPTPVAETVVTVVEEPVISETHIADDMPAVPAPAMTSLAQELNAVSHLNFVELNVELAEQYVELGEYDSAKRLLNEVVHAADGALAHKIKTLLESID